MDIKDKILVVGIGGCSRSGKTLLTRELKNLYKNVIDKDYQFTDIISSIHLDRYFDMSKINKNIVKTDMVKNIDKKIKESPFPDKKGILIIEGFLLYSPLFSNEYYKSDYLDLFDYYIYICLDKSIAKARRMKTTRVPPDYYDFILWPEHIKNCSEYVKFFEDKKKDNKSFLIIDGNKQYDSKTVALCIFKWIKVFKRYDNNCNSLYNILFTSTEDQLKLLKKNFSK